MFAEELSHFCTDGSIRKRRHASLDSHYDIDSILDPNKNENNFRGKLLVALSCLVTLAMLLIFLFIYKQFLIPSRFSVRSNGSHVFEQLNSSKIGPQKFLMGLYATNVQTASRCAFNSPFPLRGLRLSTSHFFGSLTALARCGFSCIFSHNNSKNQPGSMAGCEWNRAGELHRQQSDHVS